MKMTKRVEHCDHSWLSETENSNILTSDNGVLKHTKGKLLIFSPMREYSSHLQKKACHLT